MKKVTLYLIAVMGMLIALTGCSGTAPVPKGSQPWKNITRTPTPTPTPDPVFLIFEELNGTSDENLESTWQNCQKKIAAQNLENEWNAFCDEYSALADYQGSTLSRLRTEYGLALYPDFIFLVWRPKATPARNFLEPYVKDGRIKPGVAELLYRPGVIPNLGGTLWLYEEYKEIEETLGKPTERTESDPIRFLLVDCSETYENTPIERELFLSDSGKATRVRTRSENLISDLFHGNIEKLRPVSYPELADVVIKITVEYPLKGTYSVNYGSSFINVWNTEVTVEAVNRWNGETVKAVFSNKAPQSLTLSEVHGDYYMDMPRLRDDSRYKDDAAKLAQAILAWFPNVKKPGT